MLFPWFLTIIAVIGAYFNSRGAKKGFYFWLISNSGFMVYNYCIDELAMSCLFGVYLLISMNGLRCWK